MRRLLALPASVRLLAGWLAWLVWFQEWLYPQLYKVYVDSLYHRMEAMKQRLTPYLKPEINHEFAWSSYFILMTASSQPKTFEKIGMTREQCIYEAFTFWMNGAVDMERLRAAQRASD